MKHNLVLLPAAGDLHPLTTAVLYEVAAAKYVKIPLTISGNWQTRV